MSDLKQVKPLINWAAIDVVLLDMDGTLLDLHFDNYFWKEYVPQRYAQDNNISLREAQRDLMRRYGEVAGKLRWYCVEHWSRELKLDIVLLKQEIKHLIRVHPHVLDFLSLLQGAGKQRVLLTNAHQQSMGLKLRETQLGDGLDEIISAHELGLPKEEPAFWDKLQQRFPYDPQRTLFIDDSLPMLHSAHQHGIEHLLHVLHPDSKLPKNSADIYPAVDDFEVLLPGLSRV